MSAECKTQRLILRQMTHEDFADLFEILGDSDIMQHYPYTFDQARVRNWIDRNIERYRIFGFGLWAVVLRETGEMIGDCGITMQNINGVIRPEIGYHIKKKHQRQGYAKEAAAACRDWAFEHTPFGELYSYMKSTNIASYSTAMSIGMSRVCEYPDDANEMTAVYSITRERWERLHKRSGEYAQNA